MNSESKALLHQRSISSFSIRGQIWAERLGFTNAPFFDEISRLYIRR